MKKRTHDRARFYAPERLGEKRSVTPEGFLVCHDVPIARTGTQLYTPDEIPLEPGPDGLVRIERPPEEVFRDETAASFEGKAITVNHPDEFVTPDNWKKLSVGTVQNVRRGEGIEDDLLIADLVVTDPGAIEYVNKELPEVSAGYEAEYEQTEPGRGVQREIVGNHVALVERGRAGPRCSIQDHQKEPDMSTKTKDAPSLLARLLKAIKVGDSDEIEKVVKDAEEETPEQKAEREAAERQKATDEAAASLEARLAKIEAILEKLVPLEEGEHKQSLDADPDDEEGKGKTGDEVLGGEGRNDQGTVYTGDTLKQILSRAEILAPGIALPPTADAAKGKGVSEKLMRKALDTAYTTDEGRKVIDTFLLGRDIKTLTGDSLLGVFNGSAELTRHKNNAQGIRSGVTTNDFGRTLTVSDINTRNREFWAPKPAN